MYRQRPRVRRVLAFVLNGEHVLACSSGIRVLQERRDGVTHRQQEVITAVMHGNQHADNVDDVTTNDHNGDGQTVPQLAVFLCFLAKAVVHVQYAAVMDISRGEHWKMNSGSFANPSACPGLPKCGCIAWYLQVCRSCL